MNQAEDSCFPQDATPAPGASLPHPSRSVLAGIPGFALKDPSAVALLAAFFGVISTNLQDYVLVENGSIRAAAFVVSFLPVLCFYILARQVLLPLSGFLLSAASFYVMAEASRVKQALTGEPLGWTDISNVSHLSVVLHYVSLKDALTLLLLPGLVVLAVKLKQIRLPRRRDLLFSSGLFLVLSPIVFHPYVEKINPSLGRALEHRLSDLDVSYKPWNWARNVERSGLPVHLIQTSRRDLPENPSRAEVDRFSSLKGRNVPMVDRPRNIIFILCEACWHDETHFEREFAPLARFSFSSFRAVSPVYGGETANAEFELLTGLPSKAALTGVIYQEYAELFKDEASTFARALRTVGYRTFAAHNHSRKYWKRNVVTPKFGFDRFLGIQDMMPAEGTGNTYWADDGILFSKALEEMRKTQEPGFYFLITVHTHGKYEPDDDYGEGDYSARLGTSISRVAEFVDEALRIEPDSVILMVGDHKPALTKFFFEQGVLPATVFSRTGERNEDFMFKPKVGARVIGDVPAFFYHPSREKASEFAAAADGQPFYCLPNLFDRYHVGVDLPAFAFAREVGACAESVGRDYEQVANVFPDYLFSLSLFR